MSSPLEVIRSDDRNLLNVEQESSAIFKLPFEMLSEVFLWYKTMFQLEVGFARDWDYYEPDFKPYSQFCPRWILTPSHVCASWRAISISSNTLWDNIIYINPHCIQEFLARSQPLPIYVFHPTYGYAKDIDGLHKSRAFILGQSERIKLIQLPPPLNTLSGLPMDVEELDMQGIDSRHFPHLTHLSLHNYTLQIRIQSIANQCPKLQSIYLAQFPEDTFSGFTGKNITSLYMGLQEISKVAFIAHGLPALHSLSIRHLWQDSPHFSAKICFPNLQNLLIESEMVAPLLKLTLLLDTPSTCSIHLSPRMEWIKGGYLDVKISLLCKDIPTMIRHILSTRDSGYKLLQKSPRDISESA